jgi:hypothetical protein
MTRNDYVLIAGACRSAASSMDSKVAKQVVHFTATVIADALAEDNPEFDRSRFLAACAA